MKELGTYAPNSLPTILENGVFNLQVDKETVLGKCFSRTKPYPCARIYENSKLCLVLFSYELQRQLGLVEKSHRVSVIAVDPGVVETNRMRGVPSCLSCVAFTVLKLLSLLQSPKKGISSVLNAALPQPDTSGVYLFGGKGRTINSSALSHNSKLAHELWTTSCNLLYSHSLRLRFRKFPREYLIVIRRECLHQRKAKRKSMDLKWWQLHQSVVDGLLTSQFVSPFASWML